MRLARMMWLLVFLIPIGLFADRFCFLDVVDPLYHSLMWLHERLPILFAMVAMLSVGVAVVRYLQIKGRLRTLQALRSDPPSSVRYAFENLSASRRTIDLVYVDVEAVFCFALIGSRVVLSRGFAELAEPGGLRLVAEHEAIHIVRRDPLRALLWHLLFAALIFPGFERLEEVFYARRERLVDSLARALDPLAYDHLLHGFGSTLCADTPRVALRTDEAPRVRMRLLVPAAVSTALLMVLTASHVLFVQNLPYLQAHHC